MSKVRKLPGVVIDEGGAGLRNDDHTGAYWEALCLQPCADLSYTRKVASAAFYFFYNKRNCTLRGTRMAIVAKLLRKLRDKEH